jgi:hypothetical protein
MRTARAYFPAQDLPVETVEVYFVAWRRMLDAMGPKNFDLALTRCLEQKGRKYFPAPGEIAACEPVYVPDGTKTFSDPGCEKCGGDGWERMPGPDRRVRRCACWIPTKPAVSVMPAERPPR